MRPRRISLKEMAEQLGVSIATVSRALQNSHEVGESTRHRVQELAKKLNYRPNPFAKSLRQNRQKIIGVVVPNLVTHYYAAVLDGIEDYATNAGYAVIAANSHEDHLREKTAIDNYAAHMALTFELVYPKSRQLVYEQGYLEQMLEFKSDNGVTNEQLSQIREKLEAFLNK